MALIYVITESALIKYLIRNNMDQKLTTLLATSGIGATLTTTGGNGYDYMQLTPFTTTTPHNAIGYMDTLQSAYTQAPSKVEQAFKVMAKLKELNIVSLHSIEDFVKAVTEVSRVL